MARIFILVGFALAAVGASAPPSGTATPAATGSAVDSAQKAAPASSVGTGVSSSATPDPKDPRSWLWTYQVPDFSAKSYDTAVDALFADYEKRLGRKLAPGVKRHVGIKVETNTRGLSTSPALVRAVIAALEARGYKPAELFIMDQSEDHLHDAGFLPLNAHEGEGVFDGVQVIALNRGRYYSPKWSYDSNLTAPDAAVQALNRQQYEWSFVPNPRQSLLPVPLLLDVDFWINLPVGMDDDTLGVSGVLVDATLYAASNTARFFDNAQSGAKAVADIAAVPELSRGWVFSILSLEHYQFIGGPQFNSLYTRSEPIVLMSPNPVILDQILFERINNARQLHNFPLLDRPLFLDYADLPSMHLGTSDPKQIYWVKLP